MKITKTELRAIIKEEIANVKQNESIADIATVVGGILSIGATAAGIAKLQDMARKNPKLAKIMNAIGSAAGESTRTLARS